MNILLIGKHFENLLQAVSKSKQADKIFSAGFEPVNNIPNIEYSDFNDLVKKTKALQIDISITCEKELIQNGIADFFKKNGLNIIAVNKKWFNLELQRMAAKQLMNFYSINNPSIIKAPLAFPIVIKGNQKTLIAHSMKELVEKRELLEDENVFLEEYLEGEVAETSFLWDGKTLFNFASPEKNEVQKDRFELLKTKLAFMLSDEKADFTGFFAIKLIWAKNDWYVLDFVMRLTEKSALSEIKTDFLFLLNAAIYQKLYEIR